MTRLEVFLKIHSKKHRRIRHQQVMQTYVTICWNDLNYYRYTENTHTQQNVNIGLTNNKYSSNKHIQNHVYK